MDPDQEIMIDLTPLVAIRIYKSGRVERLSGTDIIPTSLDPSTSVTSKDVNISATVTARLYLPNPPINNNKLPILVYYHGGGFCIESPFSQLYHPYTNSLASQANILIVSVDYRLAPEHLLPAAYDDAWAALEWVFSSHADEWLVKHGDIARVFVAGDSAGANITHQLAMQAATHIEGMVLMHPYFWGREPIGAETRDRKVREAYEEVWRVVNQDGVEVDDPRLNVTAKEAPSLAGVGCGRVMVCVAGVDVLAERGRAYCEALKGSGWGGEVEIVESEGEDHCFHLQKPECEKAMELMERMVAFFNSGS